ncbi:MAG: ATP-binding cassette domain-containing protein [Rhodoglobus sp.]
MPRGRLAPLRAAAILAAAFVVLRVAYRVIFGGASGGEFRLLDLPRIPLAGPFEHITLFGPVTLGGLSAALVSALPFAAVILAFGLLNVIVDVRALFTRGAVRGPLRTVSRAIVIAWASFPALLDSVRRVRVARELRGERGAASLLVPIFEHTVERALALAASMEVRGFAASGRLEPTCERPVVMRDAALGFAGTRILEGIDLELEPGTLTLVTGPTGSGKSSLLHAMSGLFQHFLEGEQTGLIEIGGADRATTPPRETAGFVGVVPQSARLSFVAETVADELGFTLAVRGVAPVIVHDRAAETARHLGIEHLLDRDVRALSAGQAQLVAIGAAIVSRPVLLIVDEPLAELDAAARARVVNALDRLAHEAGMCVIVAEHHSRELDGIADARLELRDGAVHRVEPGEPPREGAAGGPPAPTVPVDPRASIRHLSVAHGGATAVDDVSFEVAGGELVALLGPNGAGKSSLLHAIARPAQPGTVGIDGRDVAGLKPRERRRAVALVPEAFDDLLFTTTVAEECRRADGADETFARFLGLAAEHDLLARHPRDLSAGERLCLVIAIQLSAKPALLLVDEPTRGLDPAARELVGAALARAAASGTAVMIATHDREFADRFATRSIAMDAGRVGVVAVTP